MIIKSFELDKKNLKEKLVEVAWNICVAESGEKVNMREVAKKARVSNTAFYRHLKNKNEKQILQSTRTAK